MKSEDSVLYAYLAGLIDGEGTIRIGEVGPINKHYASISIGMTNKKVLDLFARVFGSRVRLEKPSSGRQQMYRWGTSGNKVVPLILDKLLPYLIVKKRQAVLVLKFCKTCGELRLKKSNIRRCIECKRVQKIIAFGLCGACDMRHRRAGEVVKRIRSIHFLSEQELQQRKKLYQQVKDLNAVGLLANARN